MCSLFSSQQSVSGSTTLFSALLSRSLARDVVPICRYIPRVNTPPRFVALLPQVKYPLDQCQFNVTLTTFLTNFCQILVVSVPAGNQDAVEAEFTILSEQGS